MAARHGKLGFQVPVFQTIGEDGIAQPAPKYVGQELAVQGFLGLPRQLAARFEVGPLEKNRVGLVEAIVEPVALGRIGQQLGNEQPLGFAATPVARGEQFGKQSWLVVRHGDPEASGSRKRKMR
ncbi:MAG: hypothetical protein SFU86_15535 [Pirellulaceae bacterium]|nr:hypothetical protein [Pirellulaceae bacterium]